MKQLPYTGKDVGICILDTGIAADHPDFQMCIRDRCQTGSLTGAVASERVSEAPKGSLRMDGNHS